MWFEALPFLVLRERFLNSSNDMAGLLPTRPVAVDTDPAIAMRTGVWK